MEPSQHKNNDVNRENDEISNYYSFLQSRVYLSSYDKTVTSAQLIEGLEKKHGTRAQMEALLRKGKVSSTLDSILKGEEINVEMSMPSPDNYSKRHEYAEKLLLKFTAECHAEGSYATAKEATELCNKDQIIEYLCSLYLNEYPINGVIILKSLADYVSREKRKDIVNNMSEDDWQSFKYSVCTDYKEDMSNEQANRIALAVENVIRDDGAIAVDFLGEQTEFNEASLVILEHSILHNKTNIIKYAMSKYISNKNILPEIKIEVARNALLVMTEGNPATCKMFLSKDMWNTYSVTTKASILALIIQRSGTETRIPLLEHLTNKNMIDIEVITELNKLYNSDDEEQKVKYLRVMTDHYYANAAKSNPASNSVSRRLAGTIFLTPKDNSISVAELERRANEFDDSAEILEALKQRCSIDKELILTKDLLEGKYISTTYLKKEADYAENFKNLTILNNNHIATEGLINIVSHAVQLDKHYSNFLNRNNTLVIDPVIKLLAFGISERLSRENRQAAKEEIKNDRSYLKYAANRMYGRAFSDLESAGDLIEDIFYGDGKKAIAILERNKLYWAPESVALRFAVLNGQANVVENLFKKYLKTKSSRASIDMDSDIGQSALSAVLLDDKAVCLLFLENMWEFCDDRYKASLIQHIITRTSIAAKQELMGYLCTNALLTTDVTKQVHKLSMTPKEQDRINALYDPFINIQNEMFQCRKNTRKPEEILSSKVKNEDRKHALFAELSLSCQREFFGDALKYSAFIQNNLAKLEDYFSIKEDVFKSYFPSVDFIEPANKLLLAIREEVLNNLDLNEGKSQAQNTKKKNNSKAVVKTSIIPAQDSVRAPSYPVTSYLNEGKINPEEASQFESVSKDKKPKKMNNAIATTATLPLKQPAKPIEKSGVKAAPVIKVAQINTATIATLALKPAIDKPIKKNNAQTNVNTQAAQPNNNAVAAPVAQPATDTPAAQNNAQTSVVTQAEQTSNNAVAVPIAQPATDTPAEQNSVKAAIVVTQAEQTSNNAVAVPIAQPATDTPAAQNNAQTSVVTQAASTPVATINDNDSLARHNQYLQNLCYAQQAQLQSYHAQQRQQASYYPQPQQWQAYVQQTQSPAYYAQPQQAYYPQQTQSPAHYAPQQQAQNRYQWQGLVQQSYPQQFQGYYSQFQQQAQQHQPWQERVQPPQTRSGFVEQLNIEKNSQQNQEVFQKKSNHRKK